MRSEAEKRVIYIETEAGDPVIYSGNPAELPGARFETMKALKRAGAFKLLVTQNASRLPNGLIAVDHIDNIPFVTGLVKDPFEDEHNFETPCPDTPSRVARINAARDARGETRYMGIANVAAIPPLLLKLAVPNKDEVETQALAFALTQLSIFEDRLHANELLKECEYDGRKLGPILDALERKAKAEDLALVTGKRNKFKESGLNGQPLTFKSFRDFFKDFNVLEYKCPANKRTSDEELMQLVGNLFIQDPSMRKVWSDHVNAPCIKDAYGVQVSGPPQTYTETKSLAEELLRSTSVIAGIDELSNSSGQLSQLGLSTDQLSALNAANINPIAISATEAVRVADALLASSPARDPRKNLPPSPDDGSSSFKQINVPKGEDGKYLYWAPPMSQCDCGTPDEGRHIKYKWPCAYYRKDPQGSDGGAGGRGIGRGGGRGKGEGGRGKGKGSKGKGGKGQIANFTEEQIGAAVAVLKATTAASPTASTVTLSTDPSEKAESVVSASTSSTAKQSCAIAEYGNEVDLESLLNSTTLRADLTEFFAGVSDTSFIDQSVDQCNTKVLSPSSRFELDLCTDEQIDRPRPFALGAELIANDWSNLAFSHGLDEAAHQNKIFKTFDHLHSSMTSDFSRLRIWDVQRSSHGQRAWTTMPKTHIVGADFGQISTEQMRDVVAVNVADAISFIHSKHGYGPDSDCTIGTSVQTADSGFRSCPPGKEVHYAFNVDCNSCARSKPPKDDHGTLTNAVDSDALPIFRAGIDSCCTATCTESFDRLINVRKCDEKFRAANGKKSICTAIGDMPVYAKDIHGKIHRIVFKNVRYVPDFKYTRVHSSQ